jgi:hypothetical protein
MIPGNRMMARFYDDVEANIVPTITHVNQIFTDGVHTNNIGAYMITMIHYACIFGQSPVGLSNNIHPDVTIDVNLATYIQEMVWDVVTSDPRTGIVESLSVNSNEMNMEVYPNPVEDFLTIDGFEKNDSKMICNLMGKVLLISNENTIDVQELEKGSYILVIGDRKKIFIKQ